MLDTVTPEPDQHNRMATQTKTPEIPRLDSDPDYVEVREKRERIQAERAAIEADLREAITARDTMRVRHENRVEAILEGRSPNGAGAPDREHVTQLRQKAQDYRRAEERARRDEADAASRASRRLLVDLEGHHTAQMRRLAKALAEVTAIATEVARFQEDLTDAGLAWTSTFPAIALGWMRQDNPDGRLNMLIDEIARDYPDAEPDRPLLNEALQARQRAHLAEQKRLKEAGGAVAAGPDGVVEFAPGGRKRKVAR